MSAVQFLLTYLYEKIAIKSTVEKDKEPTNIFN